MLVKKRRGTLASTPGRGHAASQCGGIGWVSQSSREVSRASSSALKALLAGAFLAETLTVVGLPNVLAPNGKSCYCMIANAGLLVQPYWT